MRQAKYLNVILTVNAVLLGGLLWSQVASTTGLSSIAHAQSRTRFVPRTVLPNAAKQRFDMIDAIRDLKSSVDASAELLRSGRLKVEVTNLDAIEVNITP